MNLYLEITRSRIHQIYRELETSDKVITVALVRKLYYGVDEESKTLLQVFREHNEQSRKLIGKDFVSKTVQRYETTTRYLEEFYKKDPQMTLFDLFPEPGQSDGERMVKDANPEHIKDYILARLWTCFPWVAKHARIFRNSRRSPMFLFCFAIASESPKAQGLALRMADYILKNK